MTQASLMTMIASLTGIPEGLLNWLVATFGAAALAQVWAFIQMPRQIKKMREALVEQNQLMRLRVFPKITRLENYQIDSFLRENPRDQLPDILEQMRDDQYPDSDARDAELREKKRKEFEASLT